MCMHSSGSGASAQSASAGSARRGFLGPMFTGFNSLLSRLLIPNRPR